MNCTKSKPIMQDSIFKNLNNEAEINRILAKVESIDYKSGLIYLPSDLDLFKQIGPACQREVKQEVGTTGKKVTRIITEYNVPGKLTTYDNFELYCPKCGKKLSKNGLGHTVKLQHVPIGEHPIKLLVEKQRYICTNSECDYCWDEPIEFKADDHFITKPLEAFILSKLKQGYTAKKVAIECNVSKNLVKDIHFKYLKGIYTENGEGKVFKRPLEKCKNLGIDEFLLHKGHQYATVIMSLDTGHVLYLARGKKKQVVYDFIDWVGMDWMKNVEAVACDMNSDFEEAFRERCDWLKICFDHFHIVKNFNEKVISEVRKDLQNQLKEEGNEEEAKYLKGSKYILMTTEETRKQKEKDAKDEKVIAKGSELSGRKEIKQLPGIQKQYHEIIEKNELLILIDLIKEQLSRAYSTDKERGMLIHINRIIRYCNETENDHFKWFAKLLETHKYGITTHAELKISSGKVEGFNNLIKTVRRMGFGYPDDDYFFLLIMDASRKDLHWS